MVCYLLKLLRGLHPQCSSLDQQCLGLLRFWSAADISLALLDTMHRELACTIWYVAEAGDGSGLGLSCISSWLAAMQIKVWAGHDCRQLSSSNIHRGSVDCFAITKAATVNKVCSFCFWQNTYSGAAMLAVRWNQLHLRSSAADIASTTASFPVMKRVTLCHEMHLMQQKRALTFQVRMINAGVEW